LIVLKCIRYEKNKLVIFETTDEAEFYLKSYREVNVISDQITEIIYSVDFDARLVRYALGFSLPEFLIYLKANLDKFKYLKKLKIKIENE